MTEAASALFAPTVADHSKEASLIDDVAQLADQGAQQQLLAEVLKKDLLSLNKDQKYVPRWEKLKESTDHFWTYETFKNYWQENQLTQGFCLGISSAKVKDMASDLHLTMFREGFAEVLRQEPGGEETPLHNAKLNIRYLQTLSDRGVPVVFFVPKNLFTESSSAYTKREMLYFLKYPERAKEVHFVFYDE